MARVAFILLCHKDPDAIIKQAQRLTAAGDYVSIHFDGRAPRAAYDEIRQALADSPSVTFARRRIKCGWGEWSLVEATIEAVRAALHAFPRATHFYMLSGDCMPIKSAAYLHAFLDEHDKDFIESFNFFTSDWIKTGMKEDRLHYRHFFNERKHKRLFYASYELQKRLGLKREVPRDIQMMIGSQWWCLRRRTVEWIDEFTRQRPDVMRFFRTTWIPDETFYQTLVRQFVPDTEIECRTLTFLMFSDYGMPVTFYNDQYDLLLAQDFQFARKISPEARELRRRLGELYVSGRTDFSISNEGKALYRFLTGRGRIGRRFAPRFWERESTIGRDRELLVIACKKWHVAKRLMHRISEVTGIPGVEYLFNEEACPLPDLGGIETTLAKRTRHRRALLRMLFGHHRSDRLMICLDPANMDLLRDFYSDRCSVRLLEVECAFSDDYLIGHARRVGLAGDDTPRSVIERILPTIRHNIAFESDEIRDAGFPNFYRAAERASVDENAGALAGFLKIDAEKARQIAATDYLFVD